MSIVVVDLGNMRLFKRISENNIGRLTMNKLNYDEKSQLRTRIAILESQLNVANREVEFLKVRADNAKNNSKKIIIK